MTIKDLRKQTNLSQSRFAEKYGIPVRTIQQWEQDKSNPPEYVIRMLDEKIRRENNDYISKYRLTHQPKWKLCIDAPFLHCEKIHPLQQQKVKQLIDDLSCDVGVSKIIIFGSSTTNQCHVGSDIDIFAQMTEDYNPIKNAYPFEIDFWNNYSVDNRLMDEINKKGVVVYGK